VAALAGALLTHYTGGVGPSEAAVMKSVRYVAIVAVGGMGSLFGTLATSAALTFVSLRGWFGTLDDAVFGGILIAIMLFSPEGILRLDLRAAVRGALARLGRSREIA
jgi:branched-chain amino acid transport system permease protein